MIVLSDKQPFAKGGHRHVYVHPQDSGKCIKVLQPQRHGAAIRATKRFPRNLRSASNYDDNQREKEGYRYLETLAARHNIYKHIPHHYGWIETDLGQGMVSQLMRDYDDNISKTFLQRIQQFATITAARDDKQYTDSVNELKFFIKETLLITRKLTPRNMLSVRISEQQERLYIIEGFGAQEWIPLVVYIPIMKKKKIQRMLAKFDERIALEFSRLLKNHG